MATPIPADEDAARRRLREMIGETDSSTTWETKALDDLLLGATSLEEAAARGWQRKASEAANLTDVTEAGSSRKLGSLQKQALEMYSYYSDLAAGEDPGDTETEMRPTRVRAIVRE